MPTKLETSDYKNLNHNQSNITISDEVLVSILIEFYVPHMVLCREVDSIVSLAFVTALFKILSKRLAYGKKHVYLSSMCTDESIN